MNEAKFNGEGSINGLPESEYYWQEGERMRKSSMTSEVAATPAADVTAHVEAAIAAATKEIEDLLKVQNDSRKIFDDAGRALVYWGGRVDALRGLVDKASRKPEQAEPAQEDTSPKSNESTQADAAPDLESGIVPVEVKRKRGKKPAAEL